MQNEILSRLKNGHVCVHPTDTLLGLTFDHKNPKAFEKLMNLKKRDPSKGFILLAGSKEDAFSLWQDLPKFWQSALSQLWPGPISVIYNANKNLRQSQLCIDETVAVRVPHFLDQDSWYREVLLNYGPLPSTSINLSGEAPILSIQKVKEAFQEEVFIPTELFGCKPVHVAKPSTLIKIEGESFHCLREGAVSIRSLQEVLGKLDVSTHAE